MTNEFYIDQRVLHVPQNVVSTKGIRQMPRSNQIWTLRAVLGLHPIRWWRLADLYFGGGHKNLWNARKDIMAMSELRSRTRASEFWVSKLTCSHQRRDSGESFRSKGSAVL